MLNEQILKLCVKVNNVEFVDANNHRYIATIDMEKKGKYYDTNNGKIAFMTDDGGYYVSPFVNELIPILEAAGFTEGSVIQPFSNGAQPLNMEVARKMYALSQEQEKLSNHEQQYESSSRYR